MKKLLVLSILALTIVLASWSDAMAGDTPCVGVLTGTFDNVVVPPGATCLLNGATVRGNVKALENSRLVINNSTVQGNVEGDKADLVQVNFSTVRQNISIKEGGLATGPTPPGAFICSSGGPFTPCEAVVHFTNVQEGNVQIEKMLGTVSVNGSPIQRGNVKVEDNFIPPNEFLSVGVFGGNTIAQNLQVFKNRGPDLKLVINNTVGDTIQCRENEPPFVGGPNTAPRKEGQCF